MKTALLVTLAGALACLVLFGRCGAPSQRSAPLERERDVGPTDEPSDPELTTERRSAAGAEPAPHASDALDAHERGLVERLEAIAHAAEEARSEDLEREIGELLDATREGRDVLRAWQDGLLTRSAVARRGAQIAVAISCALHLRGTRTDPAGPRAFAVETLVASTLLSSTDREALLEALAGFSGDGHHLFDASWIADVHQLMRTHPEDATLYAGLLGHVDEDIPALLAHRADALALLAEFASAPLVEGVLGGLLQTGTRDALDLAEEIWRRAAVDAATKRAVLRTVARVAPPSAATDLLVRLGDAGAYDAFDELARRSDASDAIVEHYNSLVAANRDARGRRILVAALRGESSAVLAGVARTDPSPEVRQQALLTLTTSSGGSDVAISAVREAFAARADPTRGVSVAGCVWSAENVFYRATGRTRDDALDFLRSIARDPSVAADDRRNALDALGRHVDADEVRALESGLQAGK